MCASTRCAVACSPQLLCALDLAFINSTHRTSLLLSLQMHLTSSGVVHPLLPPAKVNRLPVELLSEIFLLVLQDQPRHQETLVLVCRRWHAILLDMPAITSRLWIRRATKKGVVQAFIQGRRTRFDVIVDINDKGHGEDFNADDFHASFMIAVQAAPRWHALALYSFPPPGEHIQSHTIVHPLEILLQPGHLYIFGTLTDLAITLSKRMESPIDILPHLQRLEGFDARHLHFPIYPPDASLPLIQTLRYLYLRSVSVQWMAGKIFPVLQECSIFFPHHINTICLRPVTMPACTSLEYDSNDLGPLRHFHHPPLGQLAVRSGQWNVRRGNPQFVAMCPIFVASAQSLTKLELQVQCSGQLLLLALSLVPALEELFLRLSSPHALSATFFRAFVATTSHADSPCEPAAPPRQLLCARLDWMSVDYGRWLRGPERTALIPVFGEIVSSRRLEIKQVFSLVLSFEMDEWLWRVDRPTDRIHVFEGYSRPTIGITGPHGIIPLVWMSSTLLTEIPIKEAEYLVARGQISIGCLLTLHHLVELRVGNEQDILTTAPPPNLPLFHTLRVLEANNIHPSFLAGQTFHKLERCRMYLHGEGPDLSQGQVTQMPVCTRLDVDDLTLLATFKLPQIRELGVSLDHPEFNMIWERHIAVNTNLSGLELLHVYGQHQQAYLIQALRCLPVLKTLIIDDGSDLDADFFTELVLVHPNETTGLMQSHNGAQISAILCPMLRSLLIEGCDRRQRLNMIPGLKQVVTLRAMCGSPLKRVTLFDFELDEKTEVIWGHEGSVLRTVVLDENDEPFGLGI